VYPLVPFLSNIMKRVNNPFVVKLYYSFQDSDNLFFVMEYLSGGDMASLLDTLGSIREDMLKMYLAEIVLALEYCHKQVRWRTHIAGTAWVA
jgi:serine/threonine protein kinase